MKNWLDIELLEFEKKDLEKQVNDLRKVSQQLFLKKENGKKDDKGEKKRNDLVTQLNKKAKTLYKNLDNWQITEIARHPKRLYALDYIEGIFENFQELHGDRLTGDDGSIIGGIGFLAGQSVVIVGQQKGRNLEENVKRNFGMPNPSGYRKALRFFQLANQFKKPIVTFIDTPGAFPGKLAEEMGQGEAIAKNLKEMMDLKVPVVSVVIGEGGSGGALGIGVANEVMMLEYAIYSVISPESCASILWRDANKKKEAAVSLKNDAKTALKFKIIDEIIQEGVGGCHRNQDFVIENLKQSLNKSLKRLNKMSENQLITHRIHRFEKIGKVKILKQQ